MKWFAAAEVELDFVDVVVGGVFGQKAAVAFEGLYLNAAAVPARQVNSLMLLKLLFLSISFSYQLVLMPYLIANLLIKMSHGFFRHTVIATKFFLKIVI